MRTPLNQRGMTIFEISIVLLILTLIAICTWIIIAKMNDNHRGNYDKYNDVNKINTSDYNGQ